MHIYLCFSLIIHSFFLLLFACIIHFLSAVCGTIIILEFHFYRIRKTLVLKNVAVNQAICMTLALLPWIFDQV